MLSLVSTTTTLVRHMGGMHEAGLWTLRQWLNALRLRAWLFVLDHVFPERDGRRTLTARWHAMVRRGLVDIAERDDFWTARHAEYTYELLAEIAGIEPFNYDEYVDGDT